MAKTTILPLVIVAMLGAAVAVPSRSSRAQATADDCLSEPNGGGPQASHWYYRTDRSTGRRCWYLPRQREKAKEAREVRREKVKEVRQVPPPKLRPSFDPIVEPKAAPPVEPAASAADPVPDISMELQSLSTSAAPIEPESARASDRGAVEPLEKRSWRQERDRVDNPSIMSIPTAPDPAAGATSNIRLELVLALVAAALALAALIARKVVRLIVVRRIRRRRSALLGQWQAASATHVRASSAFANTASAAGHAGVDHDAVAATRSADSTRKREGRRDASHDIAKYGIDDRHIEERLRQRLHDSRRATA